jgi:phosphatidylserine/phosphatidylglycerophosphate/cardiolipin synthase-like enzyme
MDINMKTLISIFISAILSISTFLPLSFPLPVDEVKPLIKKDYYPEVLDLIKNAEKSIYLVMYAVQLRGRDEKDKVNTLLEELIEAKRRGVKVKVILETSGKKSWGEYITGINDEVKKILQRNGIQVYLDDDKTTTHVKVLIVDDEVTVLGSHNWTFAAFTRNNESSVKIKSRPVAQKYISYFYSIKR